MRVDLVKVSLVEAKITPKYMAIGLSDLWPIAGCPSYFATKGALAAALRGMLEKAKLVFPFIKPSLKHA